MARLLNPVSQETLEIRNLVGEKVNDKNVQERITELQTTASSTDTKVTNVATDVTDIKSIVNNLPDSGALTSIAKSSEVSTVSSKVDTTISHLNDIKGSGFVSSDSLKDIKAAVLAIQNNTLFTASIVPQMIIPNSGTSDYQILANIYDGAGAMEDPDLELVFVKAMNAHGDLRTDNFFQSTDRTDAATKIVIYTISEPSVPPKAGSIYKDSNDTQFTVIGMIGSTILVGSWSGDDAPALGNGTLTKVSGDGDDTLTASAVDADFVAMVNSPGVGQFTIYYNVPSTHAEEHLTFRFVYYENAEIHVFDRATIAVSAANVESQAAATWDVNASAHNSAGSTGYVLNTINTNISDVKNIVSQLPDGGALSSLATASAVSDLDTKVTNIKNKTDYLPSNTQSEFEAIKGTGFAATDSLKNINDNIKAIHIQRALKAQKDSASISAGNSTIVTLEATDGWDTKNAILMRLDVNIKTGACSSFDVEIYEDSNLSEAIIAVEDIGVSGLSLGSLNEIYMNQDSPVSKKLYVKIKNNTDSGSSSFTVKARGLTLPD